MNRSKEEINKALALEAFEDRRNAGLNTLQQATDAIVAAANAEPGLAGVFTTYRSQVPQLYLNVDREKVQALDVRLNSIFSTLQSYLGTNYVKDFNFLGRTFQVNLQGNPDFPGGSEPDSANVHSQFSTSLVREKPGSCY
jgi:multidrug efflux pump subunit AcrB